MSLHHRLAGAPAHSIPRLLIATAAALALVAGACGSDDGGTSPASSTTTADQTAAAGTTEGQTFTRDDNGGEASLAVGEEVTVSLETCGGCGYEWRVTAPPDAAVVETLGTSNNPRPTSTQPGEMPIVGAPTDTVFRFRGVAAGTTELTVGYFPPADDTAEESFTMTFVVTE